MHTGTQLVCPHIKSLGLVLIQIPEGTFLWRAGRTYKKVEQILRSGMSNLNLVSDSGLNMRNVILNNILSCQM